MSDYRSNILPANIETTQRYLENLNKLKFWLDRGVFNCSSIVHKDECGEQYFAEQVLTLAELQKSRFLDEINHAFVDKFHEFHGEHFAGDLYKEQRMLVNTFIEDMFECSVDKLLKTIKGSK